MKTTSLLNGIKILVAEDNLVNQKIVNYILNKQGALVKNATDGLEAIDILLKYPFDVVLMDLQMPGKDGFEVTKFIREEMKSNVPVIALTADMFINETKLCEEAGINASIAKPFEPASLCDLIVQLLKDTQPHENGKMPTVDLSYVYEMAGNDAEYIHDVINLFLDTFPGKLNELEKHVRDSDNYEAIAMLAHFLKSSSSVIKVRDMYDDLVRIETLAKEQTGKEEITEKMDNILANFREALPLLISEKEKYNLTNQ
jgi:CheY-like chemotaxis protein